MHLYVGNKILITIPATSEEITDVDRLLDFKHDMGNISRVHVKALEDKKKRSKNVL
jgi:hypothetical protein